MVELVAKRPCVDLLPISVGGMTLAEVNLGPLTSIAPFHGQQKAVDEALKAAHGMCLPRANRSSGKEGARAIWFGRGAVLLVGMASDTGLANIAAVVDQSDAWACVTLSGEGAESVLARLVPVDLRASKFKRGHTARSQIGHMNGSITRTGADVFLILVFRSMASTLVHELKEAMEGVAARG